MPNPELDVYEREGLADEDEDVSELSFGARQDAEREMRRRDAAEGRQTGMLKRCLAVLKAAWWQIVKQIDILSAWLKRKVNRWIGVRLAEYSSGLI